MLTHEILGPLIEGTAGRLIVGFSGGLDSSVLLHLATARLCDAANEGRVHALHVNHGLSAGADGWEEHCRGVAARLGASFTSVHLSVEQGPGLEERARNARYAAFREFLEDGDRLLLAHHLDDQAETILFRLLRGSGVPGLGIPARRRLGRGTLERPLLAIGRSRLREYADAHALEWIEDASNTDAAFDRNYLRHSVLPRIAARWPQYAERMSDAAGIARDQAALARALGDLDLEPLLDERARLDWAALLQLPEFRQRNAVRCWIERAGLPQPGPAQLAQVLRQAALSRGDAGVRVAWPGGEVRRYRSHLYVMAPLRARESLAEVKVRPDLTCAAGGGVLRVTRAEGRGVRLADDLADVALRYRVGGERCRPRGRAGSHPLKKIFQELGVPPWMRDRVPLVFQGEQLVAACGLFECDEFAARPDERGYVFDWSPADPSRPNLRLREAGEPANL